MIRALALVLLSLPAWANLGTQEITVDYAETGTQHVLPFNQHNGTITAIKIQFTGRTWDHWLFENTHATCPCTIAWSGRQRTMVFLGAPSLAGLEDTVVLDVVTGGKQTLAASLTSFDGTVDYAGAGGTSLEQYVALETGVVTITDPTILNYFQGSGIADLKLQSFNGWTLQVTSGGCGIQFSEGHFGEYRGTLKLTIE